MGPTLVGLVALGQPDFGLWYCGYVPVDLRPLTVATPQWPTRTRRRIPRPWPVACVLSLGVPQKECCLRLQQDRTMVLAQGRYAVHEVMCVIDVNTPGEGRRVTEGALWVRIPGRSDKKIPLNQQPTSSTYLANPPPPRLRQIPPAFGHTKPSFLVATSY